MRPPQESARQKENALALRAALAEHKDLFLEDIVATRVEGKQGRHTELIEPSDLKRLYVRCHRAHVWVIETSGIHVRLDPSVRSLDKNSSTLSEVVRYKCAKYLTLTRPEEAAKFVSLMVETRECLIDRHQDPRCLPLHSFSPINKHDLSQAEGRDSFNRQHRRKSMRKKGMALFDSVGREWQLPLAMHSADSLHVQGFHLPTGFHWDVQTMRKKMKFTNGWERWETVNEAHLNVHPDGHVRAPHATRTWSWEVAASKRKGR